MCGLSEGQGDRWDTGNKCLTVFFKVCVNTVWTDVWEYILDHSCESSSEQMQTVHG